MSSHNICQTVLHFHRWSRKRYAAFCSIGRCVNIGTLNYKIADCSLKKQNKDFCHSKNSSNTTIYAFDSDFSSLIEETEQKTQFILVSKKTRLDDNIQNIHIRKRIK